MRHSFYDKIIIRNKSAGKYFPAGRRRIDRKQFFRKSKGFSANNLLILPVDLFPDFNFLTEQYLRCSNSYVENI
jgi:hypothetical protein